MPKKRQRNRSGSREHGQAVAGAATGQQPSRAQRRRSARRSRLNRSTLMTWGIVVLVVGVIVALVASELSKSFSSDFEFVVYQGEDVLGGSELSFSEVFDQGKPVVLNFWAGLCPPCRAEMPGFQAVHEQHGEEFILLGLDVGPFMNLGSNQSARDLLRELGITYPTARALDRGPVVQYVVVAMPTTVFFTPDGKVQRSHQGLLAQSRMNSFVEELIRESGTA